MMKKILSVFLALVLAFSALSVGASAVATEKRKLTVLSYNVSGIPVFGDTQGTQRELKGNDRMTKIGEVLSNESGADIVGTQEDFNSHDALAAAMKAVYPNQTYTSGGLPLGDGLNIFSKFPVYNVTRTKWDSCYGVLSGSADRLAEKGILYSLIEIADGVFIDFYVIHTDAGIDPKSVEARTDNFRQLAELINSSEDDRAVIVIGDYNTRHGDRPDDKFYENLVVNAGLKDSWTELCNNGNYTYNNGEGWNPTTSEAIDKVMYKNGGGIEFTPETLDYVVFSDANGDTYTDHVSTRVSLSYQVIGNLNVPSQVITEEPYDKSERTLNEINAVIDSISLIFSSVDELFYLLQQGIDLLMAKIGS